MRQTLRQKANAFMLQAPDGCVKKPAWVDKALAAKPRAKPKREEDELQIQLVDWLRTQPRILFWATPANTWVGEMTGAKLGYLAKQKRMGVRAGVPDLTMLFRNRHGAMSLCFAELKRPKRKGGTSDAQDEFLDSANARGAFTSVVRSYEDLRSLLDLAGY